MRITIDWNTELCINVYPKLKQIFIHLIKDESSMIHKIRAYETIEVLLDDGGFKWDLERCAFHALTENEKRFWKMKSLAKEHEDG